MRANVGTLDRVLRGIAGIALLSFYGAAPAPWRWLLLVLALPLLATALSGFCPLYVPLGLSTCHRRAEHRP